MEITGIISAIIVGLIVGALGRLVVPGKQSMGIILTFVLGLIGAFVGLFIGDAISNSWFVIIILQVAIAALLVFVVAGTTRRRGTV
jgi:uncharacterized membrane protein YeaQ/YmgE (transglycosylase-associated protein family)